MVLKALTPDPTTIEPLQLKPHAQHLQVLGELHHASKQLQT